MSDFADLLEKYPPALTIEGIPCYAPDLLGNEDGYDSAHHDELAGLADEHWWFQSRNALIVHALSRWFPSATSYLEIGCGTGVVLRAIRRAYPRLPTVGSELFLGGLRHTRRTDPDANLIQLDARRIPFRAEFHVIGAYDVIEHIERDDEVLTQMSQALRPGGGIILTVPQHMWLWSAADDDAHHVRRYTHRTLRAVVEGAGFEVLCSRSFVSLLLPLMMASRIGCGRGDRRRADPYREFRVNRSVNRALGTVASWERSLLRRGLSAPVGGSRIMVARKRVR